VRGAMSLIGAMIRRHTEQSGNAARCGIGSAATDLRLAVPGSLS
jgi:hypothetical protein